MYEHTGWGLNTCHFRKWFILITEYCCYFSLRHLRLYNFYHYSYLSSAATQRRANPFKIFLIYPFSFFSKSAFQILTILHLRRPLLFLLLSPLDNISSFLVSFKIEFLKLNIILQKEAI